MSRKLTTVRIIDSIDPIEGADAIEVATLGGWKTVVVKNAFAKGESAIYIEADAWVPNAVAPYLSKGKEPRSFRDVPGERLRTVKLRGQLSQGLLLKLAEFPQVTAEWEKRKSEGVADISEVDFSEALGVQLWEAAIPAEIAGQVEGSFPDKVMPRTDQERCQNLVREIFATEDQWVRVAALTLDDPCVAPMIEKGIARIVDGQVERLLTAVASVHDEYEVSMKLDGTSFTGFCVDGRTGVCSRNWELKINEANAGNTLVRLFIDSGLQSALINFHKVTGRSLAVQAELMGPAIQDNREHLTEPLLFVFDIFDIDAQHYVGAVERDDLLAMLFDFGVNRKLLKHVPILHARTTLADIGIKDVADLLNFAEGTSLVNPVREGLVFKRLDGKFSFKAISNAYLLQKKKGKNKNDD